MRKLRGRGAVGWKSILVLSIVLCLSYTGQLTGLHRLGAADERVTERAAAGSSGEGDQSGENSQTATVDPGTLETVGATETSGSVSEPHGGGHLDPVSEILLAITVILLAAKLAGDLFERIHMPAVLGELTVGVLLGNWVLLSGGMTTFEFLKPNLEDPHALTGNVLDMLSRIGVVILLFEVGLESRVKDMVNVGASSMLVATIGVVTPMVLGFGVSYMLLSDSISEWQVPVFVGATLCATSVGITARVIKDLGRGQDRESKIILGAAVIDDVMGIVVLAVVKGVIEKGTEFELMTLVNIVGLSVAFIAVALILGAMKVPQTMFRVASYLRGHGMLVVTALVICFGFSWAATQVGLAAIIGAFAGGLILEGTHYRDVSDKWKNHHLEEALAPISTLLVPIFFVAMGMSVDLAAFSNSTVWLLAAGITSVAIIGKIACYFGVLEKGLNRLAVGLGMIPRGEVGLIFAAEGSRLIGPDGSRIVNEDTFSAIIVMVMITTMVTPPLLKWAMSRGAGQSSAT